MQLGPVKTAVSAPSSSCGLRGRLPWTLSKISRMPLLCSLEDHSDTVMQRQRQSENTAHASKVLRNAPPHFFFKPLPGTEPAQIRSLTRGELLLASSSGAIRRVKREGQVLSESFTGERRQGQALSQQGPFQAPFNLDRCIMLYLILQSTERCCEQFYRKRHLSRACHHSTMPTQSITWRKDAHQGAQAWLSNYSILYYDCRSWGTSAVRDSRPSPTAPETEKESAAVLKASCRGGLFASTIGQTIP